jgi:sugar phosphate isomerase/epimerase
MTAIGEIKPALYSVTYMGHWYRGDALSLEELVERARRFGFEGIEIEAKRPHGCPLDWPRERCQDLRRRAADAGLAITAVGALNDFSSPISEYREAQLAAVRDLVRMTRDLDAGILRVFLGWTGSTRADDGGARYDIAQKVWDAAHEDFTEDEVWGFCRDALVERGRARNRARPPEPQADPRDVPAAPPDGARGRLSAPQGLPRRAAHGEP